GVELLHTALVHGGPVIALAFSPDSGKLFSTSLDGSVFGLDLQDSDTLGAHRSSPPTSNTLLEGLATRSLEPGNEPLDQDP
ncbi:unnamed protein product, partial [Chrysoparadoxa australica]